MNKKQKRNYWIFGVVIVIVLGLIIGFSGQQKDEDVIKIGVIAPMSGPLANFGDALSKGLIMAIEDLNQTDKFKVYVEDSQYNGAQAVLAYNKLATIDKVDLVINWGNPTGQAIAAQVEIHKVPFLSISTDADITEKSEYIIRLYNEPQIQSKVMLDYLRELGLNKNIAIFKLEDHYHNSIYNGLLESKNIGEEIILIDTVQWSTTDFRTSLLKLKKRNYNSLGVILCGGQIAEFYKQLKELNMDHYVTFGEDCFEDLGIVESSQGTMEGVLFTSIGVEKEFEERYIQRFNTKSSIFVAGTVYDIMDILTKANIEDKNKDVIMSVLKINNYSGTMGIYDFVETETDRFYNYPTRIRQIKNNELVTIKTE